MPGLGFCKGCSPGGARWLRFAGLCKRAASLRRGGGAVRGCCEEQRGPQGRPPSGRALRAERAGSGRAGAPCGPLHGAGLPDMAGLSRVRAAPAARSAGREPPQGAPGKPPEAARGGRCLRADKMIEEEKP